MSNSMNSGLSIEMRDFFLAERRTIFTNLSLSPDISDDDKSTTMEQTSQEEVTPDVGKYKKDQVIKAKISWYYNLNDFYLNGGHLTVDQCNQLFEVIRRKHPNGSAAYEASPYSTHIGEIKIYFPKTGQVLRSKVEDLYTVVVGGQLECQATILLIDSGERRDHVSLKDLFEWPSWLDESLMFDAMSDKARLYLSSRVTPEFEDRQIERCIRQSLSRNRSNVFDVKILDYKDETYIVDIIDLEGKSLSKSLNNLYSHSIKKFESNGLDDEISTQSQYPIQWPMNLSVPQPRFRGSRVESKSLNTRKLGPRIKIELPIHNLPRYRSALDYFKNKLEEARKIKSYKDCHIKKRMFQVKLLCWDDTESFFLIPDDPEYLKSYQLFQIELKLLTKDIDEKHYDEFISFEYKNGQVCFFKNSVDPVLGSWLRGLVIKTPKDSFVRQHKPDKRHRRDRGPTRPQLTIEMTERYLYTVRSLDYGFEVVRAPRNMRPVTDEKSFFKWGAWSLRCRLFGVYPFNHFRNAAGKVEHTAASRIMLDQWVRERTTSQDQKRVFNILFRSDLHSVMKWTVDKPIAEITFFHRFEPPYRVEHALKGTRRNIRYDCLNYDLTYDNGVADYHINGGEKSSRIDLDVVVANHLAYLGRL